MTNRRGCDGPAISTGAGMETQAKRGPGRPRKQEAGMAEKMTKVRILRDFWPTEDERDRMRAGTEIEVDTETLVDGLERGILERVKDAK